MVAAGPRRVALGPVRLPLLGPLLLASPASAAVQRVLFVGNSYTYVNDLPHTYKSLAERRMPGTTVTVDSHAVGGQTLGQAAQAPACRAKVEAGAYDFLVLQDQSCIVGVPDNFFPQKQASVEALQNYFGPQAAKHGATVVLYETWGRRAGSPTHCGGAIFDQIYPTYSAMQSKITAGYTTYKEKLEGAGASVRVARVGEAHALVRLREAAQGPPEANPATLFFRLYNDDGSHPSPLGQYLAASVFLAVLGGQPATALAAAPAAGWLPRGVQPQDAAVLGECARMQPGAVSPAEMAGEWVSMYELKKPTTWRVRGSQIYAVANGGRELLQGHLSSSCQWLGSGGGQALTVTRILGPTAYWSDGDVWTKELSGANAAVQQPLLLL
eukprot:CAMPEP_0168400428 /NCGR_PEP_ID=MMETSP0228-20121227/22594_1 /TAXON_ID=133427 /ORGANISM="Protoceratium reticulatum, Strain CCCM 535 (=CCMP 1889)" /LENGTH=383 /DNA_ID=CAMNT_0008413971 /DNA_START=82 /DNA_END=1233 /DNA_ORIENTATION=+